MLAKADALILSINKCWDPTSVPGTRTSSANGTRDLTCPRMGNGETVYCCGTVTYKYCCTRRDQHSGSSIR
ncbi:hypothetical protein CEXT_39921 [Caerostris extrusa]|uniref:Shisa N-terminal domain-containing protein n=1 Tax=Caerostris extrusa TaxID=172846 RepID=A0AAV4SS79_CAEEX|nr:hypothetical protein CEXT_39921 [Caerostris extrusa]